MLIFFAIQLKSGVAYKWKEVCLSNVDFSIVSVLFHLYNTTLFFCTRTMDPYRNNQYGRHHITQCT